MADSSQSFYGLESKKQWEKTHGLLKGLCYTFSAGSFVPSDDARFTDCKIRDTPHRPSYHIRHFLLTIVHVGKPRPKDDKWKRRRKRGYRHKMKFFRKKAASKRKNPIIRTCKAWQMMSISGGYYSFSAPMPSSMTAKQFLEEGSNMGTARVPRRSYFYASLLAAIHGYCRTEHWVSIPRLAARRLDLEVLVSCRWLQTQFLRDSSVVLETMISLMLYHKGLFLHGEQHSAIIHLCQHPHLHQHIHTWLPNVLQNLHRLLL